MVTGTSACLSTVSATRPMAPRAKRPGQWISP